MATPFLKWAGGKGKLAPELARLALDVPGAYHEPFVGAGAVFFALSAARPDRTSSLNDSNGELMNCFAVVKGSVGKLIDELHVLALEYLRGDDAARRDFYYQVRRESTAEPVRRAARLIFLNRTGYNGLYRVNRNGTFNVPHGRYANPRIVNAENLIAASSALQQADLSSDDFEVACNRAQRGDLVYLDPPYQPLSATSNFTNYTARDFGAADQVRLRDVFESLTRRGVAAVLSNSRHAAIEELYGDNGFRIRVVTMSRAINSDGWGRAPVDELLIDNFSRVEIAQALSSSPK